MNFLDKVKKALEISSEVFLKDESKIQDILAPKLRQKAIAHLRYSDTVVAQSFRGEYLASGLGKYEGFLKNQEKQGVWGTDIEAVALGELFDCHVIVTPITKGKEQKAFTLYRASSEDVPTIHLYNRDNQHWFINNNTKGKGDCLYHAFAQALKIEVASDLRFEKTLEQDVNQTANPYGFLSQDQAKEYRILAQQKAIEAEIHNEPTPKQRTIDFENEKKRIARLSHAEQQQIADDYQFALKLAKMEMGKCKNWQRPCSLSLNQSSSYGC